MPSELMEEEQTQEPEVEPVTSRDVTNVLVSGRITIQPQNFTSYAFTIPEGALGVKLEGTFNAEAGVIDVLIMNGKAFENWRIGHSSNVIYRSGIKNNGALLMSLTPGETYYLIYSNKFSLTDEKTVTTDIVVSYRMELI